MNLGKVRVLCLDNSHMVTADWSRPEKTSELQQEEQVKYILQRMFNLYRSL